MKGKLIFVCEICSSRNYFYRISDKSKKMLNLNKYCNFCRKNTLHYGNK